MNGYCILTGMKVIILISVLFARAAFADDVSDLKNMDQRWADATVKKDAAALGAILADDLRYVHGNGSIENKQQFLAALKTGDMVYHSIDFQDVAVRVLGETAVVTSTPRIRIKMGSQELAFQARFLRVYLKRKGVWQITFHQATRLP